MKEKAKGAKVFIHKVHDRFPLLFSAQIVVNYPYSPVSLLITQISVERQYIYRYNTNVFQGRTREGMKEIERENRRQGGPRCSWKVFRLLSCGMRKLIVEMTISFITKVSRL